MKTKQTILKAFASLAVAVGAVASADAQTNLGAACGCPLVGDRTEVLMTSLDGYTAVNGTYGGELTLGATLTCDKTYILDKKIYIPAGKTLTIEPGTLIKGRTATGANALAEATALIIERGGKISAIGTESCPIVFTAESDNMSGAYPISNISKWGGVALLGKAPNNLKYADNGPFVAGSGNSKLCVADGLGVVEGFATSNIQDRFGVLLGTGSVTTVPGETVGTFDENDNSGTMKYVSIRHTGAILSVGSEINGLTLASVGRGTTIDHIEIVSCGDDNVEVFGGTVNLKYISTIFGNDDMFDFDLGWQGKLQFFFGMKSDLSGSPDADNGFEMDNDDQKSYETPLTTPVIYNATIIGNAKTTGSADNSALAAINAKEFTGGEIYNSIFANYRNGLNLVKSVANQNSTINARSYADGGDSWHNWTNNPLTPAAATSTTGNGSQRLKIKCNTFVNCTYPLTTGASLTSTGTNITSGADYTQFTSTDKNVIAASLPGFDYSFALVTSTTNNSIATANDVTPNPAILTSDVAGCSAAPADGFFTSVDYRGAFSSVNSENWLSDWTYSSVLNSTKGFIPCPADLNSDGSVNIDDFLQFLPAFGTTCN